MKKYFQGFFIQLFCYMFILGKVEPSDNLGDIFLGVFILNTLFLFYYLSKYKILSNKVRFFTNSFLFLSPILFLMFGNFFDHHYSKMISVIILFFLSVFPILVHFALDYFYPRKEKEKKKKQRETKKEFSFINDSLNRSFKHFRHLKTEQEIFKKTESILLSAENILEKGEFTSIEQKHDFERILSNDLPGILKGYLELPIKLRNQSRRETIEHLEIMENYMKELFRERKRER